MTHTPQEDAPEAGGKKRSLWFNLVAVIAGLAAVMLIIGLVAGWTLRGALVPDDTVAVPGNSPGATTALQPQAEPMPDVRGLTEADARQVISDAGYDPGAVVITTVPFVGKAGTVVAQEPAARSTQVGVITLSIPVPAVMPDLAGKSLEEASSVLAAQGSRPSIRRSFVAGAEAGAVISTEPLPGSALTEEPTLLVASGAATLPLATVKRAGSCDSKSGGTVNGDKTNTGISCQARSTQTSSSWIISRAAARLRATVGLDDASDPLATAQVRVVADGQAIFDEAIRYGQSLSLDEDVANILRLEVTVFRTDQHPGSAEVVLADCLLMGGEDSLNKVEVRP